APLITDVISGRQHPRPQVAVSVVHGAKERRIAMLELIIELEVVVDQRRPQPCVITIPVTAEVRQDGKGRKQQDYGEYLHPPAPHLVIQATRRRLRPR